MHLEDHVHIDENKQPVCDQCLRIFVNLRASARGPQCEMWREDHRRGTQSRAVSRRALKTFGCASPRSTEAIRSWVQVNRIGIALHDSGEGRVGTRIGSASVLELHVQRSRPSSQFAPSKNAGFPTFPRRIAISNKWQTVVSKSPWSRRFA